MLKAYNLIKETNPTPCGTLYYDTYTKCFYFDIAPNYPINELPAILAAYRSMDKISLNHNETLRFIRARIIPVERQNIIDILKSVEEEAYSEIFMLEYTQGICCMDDFYLEES